VTTTEINSDRLLIDLKNMFKDGINVNIILVPLILRKKDSLEISPLYAL
jgi:hypothetical protein